MSVYQRLMSDGEWDIQLQEDTPRSILDTIVSFNSHVVICPAEIDASSSDAIFLAAARYVGVVRRPGINRRIGGPGLAMWLGDPDGKGTVMETPTSFSGAAATLAQWISGLLASTQIASGTVTSPGGTYSNAYQWITRRQAIDSVCRPFGCEWRINNNLTMDVGQVAVLYRSALFGTPPNAIVARNMGGRDPSVVGLRGTFDVAVDHLDYVSKVTAIGQGKGSAGGASPFRGPTGTLITWGRVVEAPDASPEGLPQVAQGVYNQSITATAGRREIKVSTDAYDVAGDITLGDDVWVWDPDRGITNTTNQVQYQGQLIFPEAMRLIGLRWPVRAGMGVYIRTQNSTLTPTYLNITPYVVPEEGDSELELGAPSVLLRTDNAGTLVQASGVVEFGPWQTYTPTISGAGTSLVNGTVVGAFRREGSTLHLRITFTMGSSSTVGAGGIAFSLPSGMTGVTATGLFQKLHAHYRDTGTAEFDGTAYVTSGSSTVDCRRTLTSGADAQSSGLSATTPHTWAVNDLVNVNGTIEVTP